MRLADRAATRIEIDGGVTVTVPEGWVVVASPPMVVMPGEWAGEPPAVVVHREGDDLRGARLAGEMLGAVERLDDPVVLDLKLDAEGRDVEMLVAHRSRGVAVTTHERHHCRADGRWVVAFTATDVDWVQLAGVAALVVASLDGVG